MSNGSSLSLYEINAELLEAIEARDASETPFERARAEEIIQAYISAQLSKVDDVAAFLRECKTRYEIKMLEAKRIEEQAQSWKSRWEWLKAATVGAMQVIGARRIDGKHSRLRLQKNPTSVDVRQPELVPSEYQTVRVKMSLRDWCSLEGYGHQDVWEASTAEPDVTRIREGLDAGESIPGCDLVSDKVHLRVE